ncbi:zinc ribbon domain-containing protein [Emticicia soli]|uniref:Zinc ribbon domain-containing protein n=1 Tax=Emticicia soli TaxID=2027878 RepID=A0ABW5JAU6_9BACT
MADTLRYKCPKCASTEALIDEIRTNGRGGVLSAVIDAQHTKYTAVTCKRCAYTELYRVSRDKITEVFDFLT